MYIEKRYRSRYKIARKGRVVLMVSAMVSCFSVVSAAPTGGVVTTGSATISSVGTTTNINQSTQKSSINWQGFSIGSNETVNFNQPSASSITLNRVVGNETSVIAGALSANGKVFLLNSNGILFTQGSSVNTSGLVASTLNLSDEDFNKNNFIFQANGSQGSVINMGTINIANSGYAALLGKEVSNQGVIVATKGAVALSSGDKITLNFNGDSLMSVTIDEGTLNALVENKNAIYADGGKVILTAKAANELLASQVNNEGLIQAQTLDDLKGEITLYAHGGATTVSGKLDASAPTKGDGGFIETSGDKVKINDNAIITTKAANGNSGLWLIDPVDFTIAASGGDMSGALLSSLLNNGSITIASSSGTSGSSGNINVNDTIAWDAASTLTLNALYDITVNKTITGKYTAYNNATPTTKAGLSLNAGHDININNAISLTNAALSMTYGNAYNIRTKASYSGTTTDANGNLVAQTDTSGGVYGSVTFNGGQGSGDALSINGNAYTLIYSMSQLDALDKNNAVTGYWYNPNTGNYDVSVATKATTITLTSTISGVVYYYNPISGAYDIPRTTVSGGTTYYYNLETGLYDRSTVYPTSGRITKYWYNPSTGKYDIPNATVVSGSIKYYNGKTGQYDQATATSAFLTYYYDPENGLYDLSAIYAPSVNIAIAHNLDASGTTYANSVIKALSGTFTGMGNSIDGLTLSGTGILSLIGQTISGQYLTVRDIGLTNININGNSVAAALIGSSTGYLTVNQAYSTGTIHSGNGGGLIGGATGTSTVSNSYSNVNITTTGGNTGGLIGSMGSNSTIIDSHAIGNVTAATAGVANDSMINLYTYVGGLVGYVANNTTIIRSYAIGQVSAPYAMYVGGLIGYLYSPTSLSSVTNSFAGGAITGWNTVGGLIGSVMGSNSYPIIITGSSASGSVTATKSASDGYSNNYVGGLVGDAEYVNISNSHATGNVAFSFVASNSFVGGLVGYQRGGSISNSYTTGKVSAGNDWYVGGIVGYQYGGSINNGFWNTNLNNNGVGSGSGTNNITGLSGDQVADAKYYADGTITQVLANRAAAAAAKAAAEQAARDAAEKAAAEEAAYKAQLAVEEAARKAQLAAEEAARLAAQKAALDEHVANANQQTNTLRKHEESLVPLVAENTSKQTPAPLAQNITIVDPTYSASIKTIMIDGKTYVIEDDEEDKK